jgi:uncharacterized protein with FMN-binding domain
MPKVLVVLAVTAVAVVLLASYHTHPPVTLNPSSALRPRPEAHTRPALNPHVRSALGPATSTPFSFVQVRATLTDGRLTGVQTVALTGEGPHTQALNARAEPILRAEALRAHSAEIDVVSGATYTSRVWIKSLRGAIARARRSAQR